MNEQNNNRRYFTDAEKQAVRLVTGRDGEADHIKPYSEGGATSVENCQLVPPSINRKKGAFNFAPRKWQAGFLDAWEANVGTKRPFMLIAIPGSGKTFAALKAASDWMRRASDRRVMVVVPTDNLRNQWKSEAALFGIDLQTKEFGTNFKSGYIGGVVTYHLVANQPLVFRKLCSVAPTLVIFDEIHHCGDDSHFGSGIKDGFELAEEKLLMSGTPWKSDGMPIPFVRYDGGGYALGDYRYDYPNALTDEVIRYLVFDHSKGTITNELTGDSLEVSESITEEEAARRLRPLLDPDGQYIRKQIEDAHRKLIECRRTIPDAGGLAICIDQFHAAKVARLIKQITRCEPSVIVSDSDMENDSVESFRKSNKEWLVAVRKVSEGTDIKRLQVLCYATNVTTELFFRQVIGRVSRVRNLEDYEGYVYLPADPRLIAAARNIENAQVLAIREVPGGGCGGGGGPTNDFTQWSTSHEGTEVVLANGSVIPTDKYRRIERISEKTGLPVTKVWTVLLMGGGNDPPECQTNVEQPTREEIESALRRECNSLAYRLSKILKVEPEDVHKQFPPHAKMSLEELEAKKSKLIENIRKEGR